MKRFLILLIIAGTAAYALYRGGIEIQFGSLGYFGWMSRTRHALIDWGVPTGFVAGYIAFALLRLVSWIGLAFVSFGVGMSGATWGRRFALMLAVWLPVIEFISDLFSSFPGGELAQSDVLFSPQIRFVSFWAVPIGVGAWYLGSLCSRLSTRWGEPPPADAAGGRSP